MRLLLGTAHNEGYNPNGIVLMKYNYRKEGMHFRTLVTCCLLVATIFATGASHAQQTTYIEIRDGAFILNGHELSQSQVPASLDAEGMNASFSFFGETTPVIEVKGRFYVIEERSIREATDTDLHEGNLNVFLTDSDMQQNMIREAYRQQVAALKEKARQLNEYKSSDRLNQDEEVVRVLSEAQHSAEQAAIMAAQLPRADMQGYWDEVRQKNVDLYDQYNAEWRMELQAKDMAIRIRNMPDGDEKDALVEELRTTLENIFTLKQANRKREVVQLQLQLEGLEKSMRDREKFKDEIIDRRLMDLIGDDPSLW